MIKKLLSVLLVACGFIAAPGNAGETPAGIPKNYKLLYAQDFSQRAALNDFVMADPEAWAISKDHHKPCLELKTQSHYKPAVRSPVNLAVLADRVFGDFVMDVELASTVPESPGRDMCICFDMQGASRFYYAHIAGKADGKAHHNIFIVNDQPRTHIATMTTDGVRWGATNAWHHVRLERNSARGDIRVYFDDFKKPILTAVDKTFATGRVGFGSFDDTGRIGGIKIWGMSVETNKPDFYRRPGKGE